MKYSKLRIAWSVVWGLAAVLLLALWARSNWREDYVGYNYALSYGFGFKSSHGRATFDSYDARAYTGIDRIATIGFYLKSFDASESSAREPQWAFGLKAADSPATYVTVPHWSLAMTCALLAVINPIFHLPRRFSLRTLLMATTLVAVVLRLVVW